MDAAMYLYNYFGYTHVAHWNNLIIIFPVSRLSCWNVDDIHHDMSKANMDENWDNNEGITVKAMKAFITDTILHGITRTMIFT